MPTNFLLESFEEHKRRGIENFRAGALKDARYHFLKAAEYLLELAQQSAPDLQKIRTKQAEELEIVQ